MDIATLIGFGLTGVAIIGSILYGGEFGIFIDIPSVIVVGGGVIGSVFIKWPMDIVKNLVSVFIKSIFYASKSPLEMIEEIGKLADTARRESVFALEKVPVDDPFLGKAMKLAADNRPPEVIEAILQLEIDSMEARHTMGANLMDGMAADGPAYGMIGTLIGLVQMLQNLSDPSAIGPAMAVALLTTFYGAVLANVICGPVKNKLMVRSTIERTNMSIVLAGTLGIVAGENPRLIKEKLGSFLPPAIRPKDEEKAG